MRLLLGTLLATALGWTPGARALDEEYRASSYVFGTLVEVTALDDDPGRAQRAVARVLREFDRMHRELHAWQPGPLVALNEAIARGEKDIATTGEIATLIEDARRLSERSGDLFNPAIGKLVALWSFHRDRPGGPLPDSAEIARIVHAQPRMEDLAVNGNRVSSANREVRLDFGGYAKGYALDQAARILRDEGVSSALVNVGGNILALGTHGGEPWRIGLERPRPVAGSADLLGTIELANGEAIGTSGDYRRFYVVDGKRYSHIIDPRSGYPVAGVRSVTVIAPPGAHAGAISDGASKPLFIAGVAGWRQAAQRLGITQALLVDDEGRVHMTPQLEKRLQRKEGTSARRALR
ncbi:MAG TPA: FAD:protein FMN transferase [Burkholderiales bacterium]|jgi:thiamine biosynthesis lipoprotein|nr:FAD:protein FMN transferase [Burkholderiales bacterium]